MTNCNKLLLKQAVRGLTERAKDKLLRHPWQGNFRKWSNVIERAAIFTVGDRNDLDTIILGEEKRIRHPADQAHIPEKDFSLKKNHLLLRYNQTVDLVIRP